MSSASIHREDHPAAMSGTSMRSTERELIATRTYDAPVDPLWQVWSDPKHLTNWWGPYGFFTTTHEMNFAPNGVWRFTMHGPDGRDYKNKVIFTVVDRPHRIEYHHADDGEVEPVCFNSIVTFEPLGDKTRMTFHMTFPTPEDFQRIVRVYGADEGLRQTTTRLAEHLATLG
ncbi:MAG: SRPBCC family protein [Phycisphaeraceae bacterium]|nr:SRPBCC family protein [Phycisphaeraceae bacterium]